ncbi:MAG: hypothetical protein M1393_03215 [Candidatus Thermoplasmatota archaeon]|jgi:hypothetical protein|nr:hypothetical protein [Candidatus Thermoplasmatota archaeon]
MPFSDIEIFKVRSEEYLEEAEYLAKGKKWDPALVVIESDVNPLLRFAKEILDEKLSRI